MIQKVIYGDDVCQHLGFFYVCPPTPPPHPNALQGKSLPLCPNKHYASLIKVALLIFISSVYPILMLQ